MQLHLFFVTTKAYYQRAQALEYLGEHEECVRDYIKSYELVPQKESFSSAVKEAADHGKEQYTLFLTLLTSRKASGWVGVYEA